MAEFKYKSDNRVGGLSVDMTGNGMYYDHPNYKSKKVHVEPQKKVQWRCVIDSSEFNENGSFRAYFWPNDPENQNNEELTRFTLALTEFVKNYHQGD